MCVGVTCRVKSWRTDGKMTKKISHGVTFPLLNQAVGCIFFFFLTITITDYYSFIHCVFANFSILTVFAALSFLLKLL